MWKSGVLLCERGGKLMSTLKLRKSRIGLAMRCVDLMHSTLEGWAILLVAQSSVPSA